MSDVSTSLNAPSADAECAKATSAEGCESPVKSMPSNVFLAGLNKPEVISDDRLNELLAACPAERVTKEMLESHILSVIFTKLGSTVTHCRMILDNGFSVSGESACVNEENYNRKLGERIAYDNAFDQLWSLYGFLLAEKNRLRCAVGMSINTPAGLQTVGLAVPTQVSPDSAAA